MHLLWLLACTDSETEDTDPKETVDLYGYIHEPQNEIAVSDVLIYEVEKPSFSVTSSTTGYWFMQLPPQEYIHLRYEKTSRLQVDAWISPFEASDPAHPYPVSMGTNEDRVNLYGMVGATPQADLGTVFVDAISTDYSCIDGATINISLPYEGVWRQEADGQWSQENLSNPDRADLMFVNVEPGILAVEVIDPNGKPCVGPTGMEVTAGLIAQVSYYCDMSVQP